MTGQAMDTRVRRDQFELREGVLIHTPTQAEFTPHPDHEDSMMRTVWREMFLTRSRLALTDA